MLGETVNSLHPGSTAKYQTGQIRQCDEWKVRIQGKVSGGSAWEETQGASEALCKYISALPHTGLSIANTSTTYVPCQFRQEEGIKARIQIAGPELNRPWGAEFVIPLVHWKPLPPSPTVGTPASQFIQKEMDGLVTNILANTFSVGDKVVIVKEGDGCDQPCDGGPPVGTKGTVLIIGDTSLNGDCGPIKFGHDDGTWYLTPEHIAFASSEAPKSQPLLGKAATYLRKFGTCDMNKLSDEDPSCADCGKAWMKHSNEVCPKEPESEEVPF